MLTHWFIGSAIMFLGSFVFGYAFGPGWLVWGAVVGALPDILSWGYGFSWTKNSHQHRENWSHSILWYGVPLSIALAAGGWRLAVLTLIALVSHPLLDSFGLGFGIRIFYPFSNSSLYLRRPLKKIWYSEQEIEKIIAKENDDDWRRNIFLTWPSSRPLIFWSEAISLIGLAVLIIFF